MSRVGLLARVATAYAAVVSVLLGVGALGIVESGPLAVPLLGVTHLALAAIAIVPVAVVARSRALAFALGVVALGFAARFGSEWVSLLSNEPSAGLTVATWNLEAGARAGPDAVRLLLEHGADLVALQELTPAVATAIETDETLTSRYPHRALEARDGIAGMGLLSAFPLSGATYDVEPVRQEARLASPRGSIAIVHGHPFPARIGAISGVPVSLDPALRNDELVVLRRRVDELDGVGLDVLLIGDFNTAPTEPAFRRLTSGLFDAHAETGFGPGWTWRPSRFASLGIGLLRIDLVLSTSGLRPVSASVDCPSTGDHCLVEALLVRSGSPS